MKRVLGLEGMMNERTNRFFEIARAAALEYAAIHDILFFFGAIDAETNHGGKSTWKQNVSMLTRLIQLTESEADGSIEYEYEYRKAEYEYEYEESPYKALDMEPQSTPF